MKTFKLMIPVATIALTIFFAMPSFGEKITKKELEEDVQEAAETIKKYSIEQRDEAVKSIKSTLENIDKRIDAMESDLNEKWKDMSKTAREKKKKGIRALKKKRNEVAEWYGGMKHGSANAWDKIKKGFSNAYQALGEALNREEGTVKE